MRRDYPPISNGWAYSGGRRRGGLVPTITATIILSPMFLRSAFCSGAVRTFSSPMDWSAATSAVAIPSNLGSETWTWTPLSGTSPIHLFWDGKCVRNAPNRFWGQSTHSQPNLLNALSESAIASANCSSSLAENSYPTFAPSNDFIAPNMREMICAPCSGVTFLAMRWLSSAMILDCCAELIPSSKTNRKMVHKASIATPPTISQNAARWTAGEYLGRSKIIPAPTAMLASTLKVSSPICGQKGSKPPDQNLLTYVSIAAISARPHLWHAP
jgi:hypothetical protein